MEGSAHGPELPDVRACRPLTPEVLRAALARPVSLAPIKPDPYYFAPAAIAVGSGMPFSTPRSVSDV